MHYKLLLFSLLHFLKFPKRIYDVFRHIQLPHAEYESNTLNN